MGSPHRRALIPEEREKWSKRFREYEPKTNPTMYALQSVAQHWVENEALIERAANEVVKQSGPKWTPKVDDADEVGEFLSERGVARMMHDDILIPMHRYSCVVMLCATVERELKRLVENLEKERGPQKLKINDIKEGSYLARVAKFVDAFYGLQLADCPQYRALAELQKIRNCIVHDLGDVELLEQKAKKIWDELQKKRPGLYVRQGDIKIKPECIEQFLVETWEFFTWVFNKLNWKIDSLYQGNRLGQTLKDLN